ncbi:MAG: hypothetical protein R2724_20775 [Bryobacterales bacterium]
MQVTPVESLRERVYQIFGSDALDQLVEARNRLARYRSRRLAAAAHPRRRRSSSRTRHRRQVFSARGFVSKPHVEKLSRNSIFLFVNNRLIRDRVLLKSISSAYHNILPPGSFPFTLLFLDMPFDEVDVNVHPAKTEVRFRHQSFVYDFVRDAIATGVLAPKPVSTMPMPASPGQPATKLPFSEGSTRIECEDDQPSEVAPELRLKPQAPPTARLDFSTAPAYDFPPNDAGEPESAPAPEPPQKMPPPASAPTFPSTPRPTAARVVEEGRTGETLADVGSLRALGQIKDSFIIAAGYGGLYGSSTSTSPRAHPLRAVLRNRQRGAPESQRLLMPIIVTLTPEQQIAFDQINEELDANGFEIEPFGHRTVAVKAAPAGLSPSEIETLLHEILETPDRELRELSLDDLQKQVAATVACHAAIKINTPLDPPKMRWLLEALGKTECPMACPHGRPIALKYELKDILKAFHRI